MVMSGNRSVDQRENQRKDVRSHPPHQTQHRVFRQRPKRQVNLNRLVHRRAGLPKHHRQRRDQTGDANQHKNINPNTRRRFKRFPDLLGVGQNQSHVAAILGADDRIARGQNNQNADCQLAK